MKVAKYTLLMSMCLLPVAMRAEYDHHHHDYHHDHAHGYVHELVLFNRMAEPVDVTVDIRFGADRHYTMKPGTSVTVKDHHAQEWGIRGVRINGVEFKDLAPVMNIVADKDGAPMLQVPKKVGKEIKKHVEKKAAVRKTMKQAPMDKATMQGVIAEETDMLTD